jgi:hypothetical protein
MRWTDSAIFSQEPAMGVYSSRMPRSTHQRISGTVWAALRPRQDLVLENLLLRPQLAILARRFCTGWREHLAIVTPDTVVRWHRQGWRLFWRWKSRSRGGRPHLSPEVRELIATISREHPLWGTERIRGELLKLGIVVSNRSIRRYRWRGLRRASSQTWRTFLANYAPGHKQRRRILRAWARHDAAARLLAAAVAVDGYLRVEARRSVG